MAKSVGQFPICYPAELKLKQFLLNCEPAKPEGKLLAICSRVNVGLRGVDDLVDLVREPIVEHTQANDSMIAPRAAAATGAVEAGYGEPCDDPRAPA